MRTVMVLAVTAAAASAWAQPGGQGRSFGRGFGFGMPTSATSLAAMDEVQVELKTTEEQNTKIEELADELRSETREAFGSFQDLQNLSDDERDKRMAEGRKKAEEAAKTVDAQLANVLKPEQNDRLNQLRLQRDGIASIARGDVAETLGLTAEQKAKVEELVTAARGRNNFRGFRDLSEEEREKAMAEARERREKSQTDLLAVLTPEQKKRWEELQGEKFAFPERSGRGNR